MDRDLRRLATGWGKPWETHPAAFCFLAALAAYLSTFHWHGGDDLPNILLPFSILRHGTLTLDPFLQAWFSEENRWFLVDIGGRHLSVYPPATGILALPFCLPAWMSGAEITVALLRELSKASASVITAASVAVFFKAVSRRCSRDWALGLCFLYGLGSWAFSVSSQALWQHGPAQLAAALGLWGLAESGRRWDVLAGAGFSLTAAVRPDGIFLAAAVLAYLLLYRRERCSGFLAGSALPAVLTAAYWIHYTGRLLPPEWGFQAAMLRGFQPRAFWALLFSPARGLLLYFPAAVFGVWGAKSRVDRLILLSCAAHLLLLCFYDGWVGGNTCGTRYFAVTAMLLAWLCAGIEEDVRRSPSLLRAWAACVLLSVFIHAFGAYTRRWPGPSDIAGQKAAAWDWSLHPLLYALSGKR